MKGSDVATGSFAFQVFLGSDLHLVPVKPVVLEEPPILRPP